MVRAAFSRTASTSNCRTTSCTAPTTKRCARSAAQLGLPLVATNDCHYLHRDDARAHEVLLCIQTGKTMADETRWRFDTDELYVKTPEEMATAFGADSEPSAQHDRNRAPGRLRIRVRQVSLSRFIQDAPPSAERCDSEAEIDARARARAWRRASPRCMRAAASFDETPYYERFDRELPVIREMGFSGYMLIVADFIDYARSQGIPVGPGRGSVVGSLVSYALGITEVDPIEHKLLFERWLNPGRKSMPDIDVDFCFERRDEVLDYVRQKYGDDRVAQIITFGTIKGKQAIRDVGRVLGSVVRRDRPHRQALSRAQAGPRLPARATRSRWSRGSKSERKSHPELFDYAFKLEGLLRHASRHAAGVVISDVPLAEMVPLYVDKERTEGAMSITQYSMKGVEEIGLIKFDFLALKNLTLIADTLDLIAAERQDAARPEPPAASTIPRATGCSRAATRSACSRWKARGCAAF